MHVAFAENSEIAICRYSEELFSTGWQGDISLCIYVKVHASEKGKKRDSKSTAMPGILTRTTVWALLSEPIDWPTLTNDCGVTRMCYQKDWRVLGIKAE